MTNKSDDRANDRFESTTVGLKGLNCELFGGLSQYEGRIVERYLNQSQGGMRICRVW